MNSSTTLQPGDALIIVDVQNDFLPGGALAVSGGDEIIPILNRYIAHFDRHGLPIFATRDWHPPEHLSFRAQCGPWPPHCVQFSHGAEFAPNLRLPPRAVTISKGTHADEGYSALNGTDLETRLHMAHVRRLFIGGLATDYCVLHTVRDAIACGFEVWLLRDAIQAVNLVPTDGRNAEAEMMSLGAVSFTLDGIRQQNPADSALLTDAYEVAMMNAYFETKMTDVAVFEFFVRNLPPYRHFLVAAGLEQVLVYLEELRFHRWELNWLKDTKRFTPESLEKLRSLRFTGEVHAMPEGTVFFPHEPILRVTAPIAEAQLVETRIINLLQFQTLIASKAARAVLAARGKPLVDFGSRRAHGAEAAVLAARACYIAGFTATSDLLAAQQFGIPAAGTMAHSFVEAAASEEDAFLSFARANRNDVVLLIDTFDTEEAARKVVRLAPQLREAAITIKGVRIDSGDLAEHARRVRVILNQGGLPDVTIFASGNLDEYPVKRFVAEAVPIDAFGLGTKMVTSADAPYLDCAYKLQVYAGQPRCKRSEGKATWPGTKQVVRQFNSYRRMESDLVTLAGEKFSGEPLLRCVMRKGERVGEPESLALIRERAAHEIDRLPTHLRTLSGGQSYPVYMSERLHDLAIQLGVAPHPASAQPRAPASVQQQSLRPQLASLGEPHTGKGEVDHERALLIS